MTTELEHFLGPDRAREFIWAFVWAVGRAGLMLFVAALAVGSLLACACEFFWFLFVVGSGAAIAVMAWRE